MSGFVYIWFDVKRNMFYVGSHWGHDDDGYVCSSVWMKRAFKKRPESFKRRILSRHHERLDLLSEEKRWLDMIHDDEIGSKYYNLTKQTMHWHATSRMKTIRDKLVASWTPERKRLASISQSAAWTDKRRAVFREKTLGSKRTASVIEKMRLGWTDDRRNRAAEHLRSVTERRFKDYVPSGIFDVKKSEIAKRQWEKQRSDPDKLEAIKKKMSEADRKVREFSHRDPQITIAQWEKQRSNPDKLEAIKKKMSESKKGRVWVNYNGAAKMISLTDVENFEKLGWIRGRK